MSQYSCNIVRLQCLVLIDIVHCLPCCHISFVVNYCNDLDSLYNSQNVIIDIASYFSFLSILIVVVFMHFRLSIFKLVVVAVLFNNFLKQLV